MSAASENTQVPFQGDPIKGFPEKFVIVIGRQFGSGGRTIGKIIASKLGTGYYDTELLKKAAESEGVSPQIFKDIDEKKPSVLKNLLQGVYGIADNFHTVPFSRERLHSVKAKVIKDICEKGNCVIVGRSADLILRNHPNLFSVFLHAPVESRVRRIMNRKDAPSEEEALEMARNNDKRREAFYNFYSGEKNWGVAGNYHLSLDTSGLEDETVADIIISIAKNKFSAGRNRAADL